MSEFLRPTDDNYENERKRTVKKFRQDIDSLFTKHVDDVIYERIDDSFDQVQELHLTKETNNKLYFLTVKRVMRIDEDDYTSHSLDIEAASTTTFGDDFSHSYEITQGNVYKYAENYTQNDNYDDMDDTYDSMSNILRKMYKEERDQSLEREIQANGQIAAHEDVKNVLKLAKKSGVYPHSVDDITFTHNLYAPRSDERYIENPKGVVSYFNDFIDEILRDKHEEVAMYGQDDAIYEELSSTVRSDEGVLAISIARETYEEGVDRYVGIVHNGENGETQLSITVKDGLLTSTKRFAEKVSSSVLNSDDAHELKSFLKNPTL